MSVTVQIPTPLRHLADNRAEILVEASTVGEALGELIARHPALRPHLYSERGSLRSFVSVFLRDQDVRWLDGEGTAVAAGDSLLILPSIAGGR